jgi:DNA-directed RNA polymerase specialized sigma24 family protein
MTAWTVPGDRWPAPQPDSDVAELLRQAALGNGDVWGELVDRFGGLVLAAARAQGLSDTDVADVAWLTWTNAVEHIDRLEPECFGAWLTAVARQESRRVARTAALRISAGDDTLDALDRAYARLPERERLLVELLQREPVRRIDSSADAAA